MCPFSQRLMRRRQGVYLTLLGRSMDANHCAKSLRDSSMDANHCAILDLCDSWPSSEILLYPFTFYHFLLLLVSNMVFEYFSKAEAFPAWIQVSFLLSLIFIRGNCHSVRVRSRSISHLVKWHQATTCSHSLVLNRGSRPRLNCPIRRWDAEIRGQISVAEW